MRLVDSIEEIKTNMNTLNSYLESKRDPEYSYALDRVKKGTCFIADNSTGRYRFYPSRFVGYANNTMNRHEGNADKSGLDTNPVLTKILGQKPSADPELENAYREYCEYLGFTPNERGAFGVERKYWKI